MKNLILLFSVSLLVNSCSLSSPSKEDASVHPSDDIEFAVDTLEPNPSALKVEESKIVESKIPDEISPVEKPVEVINEKIDQTEKVVEVKSEEKETVKAEVIAEEKKIIAKSDEGQERPMIVPEEPKFSDFKKKEQGAEEKYHVQKGETLMMVAFKIYGDYRKWHDIKKWNSDKLTGKISSGMDLKYYLPDQEFGWKPAGLPYLVKSGDTLGIISNEKYGTTKKWRQLYENNKPLIRDPNLIFAGFTIYYIPTRDIASKRK